MLKMIEIKCAGINEKGLPPQQFQMLFTAECQKEGQIIQLQFINNQIGIATVRK